MSHSLDFQYRTILSTQYRLGIVRYVVRYVVRYYRTIQPRYLLRYLFCEPTNPLVNPNSSVFLLGTFCAEQFEQNHDIYHDILYEIIYDIICDATTG